MYVVGKVNRVRIESVIRQLRPNVLYIISQAFHPFMFHLTVGIIVVVVATYY